MMSGEIEEEEEELPPRGFVDPRARLPKEILDELEAEEAEEAAREAARAAAVAAEEPLNPHDVEIRFEDYHDEDTQIQVIMDLAGVCISCFVCSLMLSNDGQPVLPTAIR